MRGCPSKYHDLYTKFIPIVPVSISCTFVLKDVDISNLCSLMCLTLDHIHRKKRKKKKTITLISEGACIFYFHQDKKKKKKKKGEMKSCIE